jgi:hypothetical protein
LAVGFSEHCGLLEENVQGMLNTVQSSCGRLERLHSGVDCAIIAHTHQVRGRREGFNVRKTVKASDEE